ncbi:hypothetical protein BVIET440_260012 [Burkholderia vietnamiensis]
MAESSKRMGERKQREVGATIAERGRRALHQANESVGAMPVRWVWSGGTRNAASRKPTPRFSARQ